VTVHAYKKYFCTSYSTAFKLPGLTTCNIHRWSTVRVNGKRSYFRPNYIFIFLNLNFNRFCGKLQNANKENFLSFSGNSIRSLQALSTRKIFSHLAFYKQKIRIFTSSIYDTSRCSVHMFVSSEDAAASLSHEIASFLQRIVQKYQHFDVITSLVSL
jgi:hypothetical protein